MTREDIIRLAREAGFEADSHDVWITDGYWSKELERFADLVAAAKEQEMLAEGWVLDFPPTEEGNDGR